MPIRQLPPCCCDAGGTAYTHRRNRVPVPELLAEEAGASLAGPVAIYRPQELNIYPAPDSLVDLSLWNDNARAGSNAGGQGTAETAGQTLPQCARANGNIFGKHLTSRNSLHAGCSRRWESARQDG